MSIVPVQSSVLSLVTLTRHPDGKGSKSQAQTRCFRSVEMGKSPFQEEISKGSVTDFDGSLRGPMCGEERVQVRGQGHVCSSDRIVHRKKNWRWGMQVGWPGQRCLIAFGESIVELLMGEKCKNRGKRGIKYQRMLHVDEPRNPHAVGSFPASSFSLQCGTKEKALALESHRPSSESQILFPSFGTLG